MVDKRPKILSQVVASRGHTLENHCNQNKKCLNEHLPRLSYQIAKNVTTELNRQIVQIQDSMSHTQDIGKYEKKNKKGGDLR